MHLLVLLLIIVGCSSDVRVSINQNGGYNISIGDRIWLRSSRTAIYVDNNWYSSTNNSLLLVNIAYEQENYPNLSAWNETQLVYDLIRSGTHTKIVGHIRQWSAISAITFYLDTGDQIMDNTVPFDIDHVRTAFPSFHIEQNDQNDQRANFTFEGWMTSDDSKLAGSWNSSSRVVHSGISGGLVVIFNLTQRGEDDILVLSPFSRFMATSLCQTNNTLEYGVEGAILSIPTNYNHSMIVFYSSKGINEGVRQWGQTMQRAYNRTNEHRLNDLTINYLGYHTDNGAYYCGHTEKGINYEETLVNIHHQIPLPFHYIQLDAWWYYKGIGGGAHEWGARPDTFPNGLQVGHRRLDNLSFVAHSCYWAYDTVYQQNYSFILDESNEKSLPIGNDSFWFDLFTEAHNWGLIVCEQDYLVTQTMNFYQHVLIFILDING